MNAQPASRYFADEDDGKRVRTALDERLQRWAKWQLAGRPLSRLELPSQSTLAGIQSLRLTERAESGMHTAHARQSTVARMIRDEEHRDEEVTERAVFELGRLRPIYPAVIRAEYLWIVPVWNQDLGSYQQRQVRRDRENRESSQAHRRRMAMQLGRSLERYLQLLAECRPALALLIEQFDDGWIHAATSA
jgi:hypothetical protein